MESTGCNLGSRKFPVFFIIGVTGHLGRNNLEGKIFVKEKKLQLEYSYNILEKKSW